MRIKLFNLLFFGLLILSSCKEKEKPVTKEEAKAFAETLQKTIAKREEDFFNDAFSISEVMKSIENNTNGLSKQDMSGMKEGISSKLKLGTQVIASLSEGGTYQLVRIYEDKGEQHIIFRLYNGGKLNYHDMRMVHEKGKVKIADMFIYLTGENLSETMGNIFNSMVSNGANDAAVQSGEKLAQIKQLFGRGRYEEAMEKITSLPKVMQDQKSVALMKLQVAMNMDDSIYIRTLDEFNSKFPNNGKMGLILLDGYVLHKDYEKTMDCINQVDSLINKDPLLDYYRAICFNLMKDSKAARSRLEILDKSMPDFTDGQLELVVNYCETGDWEKAGALVNKIKDRRDYKSTFTQELELQYPNVKKYIN